MLFRQVKKMGVMANLMTQESDIEPRKVFNSHRDFYEKKRISKLVMSRKT